jgi:hypothetical protein
MEHGTAGYIICYFWKNDRKMSRKRNTIPILFSMPGTLNWPLLIFLLLFLNVKLYVKIGAIIFALVLHRDNVPGRKGVLHWKRFLSPDLFRKKWIAFYVSMLLLAVINLLIAVPSMSRNGLLAFALGCGYWIMAMIAGWQVYLFVRNEGNKEKLHRTVTVFLVLNMMVVLSEFVYICIDAGSINPFSYRGQHQKYFLNAGDFLSGVTMDSSVTTALINAMGLFYFLYRGQIKWSFLSLVTVLLAASNWIDLLVAGILAIVFLLHTDRVQKGVILVYFLVAGVFMLKVSPDNMLYAKGILTRLKGVNFYQAPPVIPHPKTIDLIEKKEIVARRIAMAHALDSLYTKKFRDSIRDKYPGWEYSGRWIAWKELKDFFMDHPSKLLTGAGLGNFGSRIAFKTTAMGIDGQYPRSLQYINPFFRDHYLFIYLNYHSSDQGQHSIVNKPDSVYAQLLGEYGLAGVACFFLFYIGFFIRGVRSLTYGLPLLMLMCAAFLTQYWFEELSVVVLFEFLMLLDQSKPLVAMPPSSSIIRKI